MYHFSFEFLSNTNSTLISEATGSSKSNQNWKTIKWQNGEKEREREREDNKSIPVIILNLSKPTPAHFYMKYNQLLYSSTQLQYIRSLWLCVLLSISTYNTISPYKILHELLIIIQYFIVCYIWILLSPTRPQIYSWPVCGHNADHQLQQASWTLFTRQSFHPAGPSQSQTPFLLTTTTERAGMWLRKQ